VEDSLAKMKTDMKNAVKAGYIATKDRQSVKDSLEEHKVHGTTTIEELEKLGALTKVNRTVVANKGKFHSMVAEVSSVAPHC